MNRRLLAVATAFILTLIALADSGCLSNKQIRLSDQELYNLAQQQFNKKKYIKSRETFTYLIDYYPDSSFSAEAQLLKADSFYREKNYIEAAVEFNLFLEFHPAHPKADYALFQEAECHYQHIRGYDRDMTDVQETLQKLQKLVQLYPGSPFVPQATDRIIECQRMILEHGLYVARFYYRWGELQASRHRYDLVLKAEPAPPEEMRLAATSELAEVSQEYRDTLLKWATKRFMKGQYGGAVKSYEELLKEFADESENETILYRLATSYQNTKKADKAKEFFEKLLEKFPRGDYAERAREQLSALAVETPETAS